MKRHTLTILSILLMWGSYGFSKSDELDYSTEHIREIWQACSFNFQGQFPQIPQRVRWPLCDCYVDHLRNTLTSLKVKTLSPVEAQALGLEVAVVCPIPEEFKMKPETLLKDPPTIPIPRTHLEYKT